MQRDLLKGRGKETTDSFIANDFSVLFGVGGGGVRGPRGAKPA